MERNTRLFGPFFVVKAAGVYVPYLVPFLLALHLNEFRVTLVVGATALTAGILEIPTGYLADGRGRRLSIVLGTAIAIVASALYATATGFGVQVFAAAILAGVAGSLVNGADAAMVYETYVALGREHKAHEASFRLGGLSGGAEAVGAIASLGLYVLVGYRGVMWVQALLWAIALLIALRLCEPPHVRKLEVGNFLAIMRRNMLSRDRLPLLVFSAFASNLSAALVWWTPIVYMYATGLKVGEGPWGWLYNFVWAGFLGSLFVFSRFNRLITMSRQRCLCVLISVAAVSYAVVATGYGWVAVVAILGTYLVRAFILPLVGQIINERTVPQERATVQSMARTLMWLLSAGTFQFSGVMSQKASSISAGIFAAGCIVVGGAALSLWWLARSDCLKQPKAPV